MLLVVFVQKDMTIILLWFNSQVTTVTIWENCLFYTDCCFSKYFFKSTVGLLQLFESESTVCQARVGMSMQTLTEKSVTVPLSSVRCKRTRSSCKGRQIDCCPCPPPATPTHGPLPVFTPPHRFGLLLRVYSLALLQRCRWRPDLNPGVMSDSHVADDSSQKKCAPEPQPSLLCSFLSQVTVLN